MKILFVDYRHVPAPDAIGNCVQKIRGQLASAGVSSDVLSFKLTRNVPDVLSDEYGSLYTAATWMSLSYTGRSLGFPAWRVLLRSFIAVPVKLFHKAISLHGEEETFAPAACKNMRRTLERLCRENCYDWVVAVSLPYCIHKLAAAADLNGAHLALYYFDPFTFNATFSEANTNYRLKEELKTCAKAELIFASLEHEGDWRGTALSQYVDKVVFLPYPNLVPYDGKLEAAKLHLDSGHVNVLYLGTLYDGVRTPDVMLRLFEKMHEECADVRLYIVGSCGGQCVTRMLDEAQKTLENSLVISPSVPFPQAMDLLRRSDAVINLGNKMKNQMPSKLLDYIAAGKPIINISPNRPCNTHPYIARYPMAVQFYNDELADASGLEAAAEKAVDFVVENRGKSLSWAEVESTMSGFTSADVAKKMLHAMDSAKK